MYSNPYFPQQQQILPQQQVLRANGKASVDSIRLAPNSSVLVLDNNDPIVWMCISDGLGNVTATPYDIIPHKDAEQERSEGLAAALSSLQDRISKLEALINESYAFAIKQDAGFPADQTGVANAKKRRKPAGDAFTDDAE